MPISHIEIGRNRIGYGLAQPSSGKYEEGDVVFNLDISNGILAWACTDGGTPGLWTAIQTNDSISAKASGTLIANKIASINFAGAGVAAVSDPSGNVTVTVSGGGGGGGSAAMPGDINVKDWGAVGDGVTDDTAAIANAKAQVNLTNGNLFFPPGTYIISGTGILLGGLIKGIKFRGANAHTTIIKMKAGSAGWMMQGGAFTQGITFEDLTFDGNNITAGVLVAIGANLDDITFRRCRVQNSARFVHSANITKMLIEDCWTHGGMKFDATAIFLDNCRNVTIRRNSFLYWGNGILGDTGSSTNPEELMLENIFVQNNYFDGAWTMWPSLKSNSGGTITYAQSSDFNTVSITDTAGGFSALTLEEGDHVRVLEVARAGTFTTVNPTRIEDSGAAFKAQGLYRGDIVRCGTKWAFISGVESETGLGIEGWLDSTTYLPVAPPSNGASYTAYRVILGQFGLSGVTDTTITASRWFRTTGAEYMPAAGSLYEIAHKPSYAGVHMEYGAKNVWITHNVVKRSWSDQISYYGNRGKIEDNIIMDGMDVGITINGHPNDGHNSIRRNTIIHAGSECIWIGSSNNNWVSDNICIGGGWVTTLGNHFGAGIIVQGSNYNTIERNLIDGENLPVSCFGVCIVDASYNVVRHNMIRNVLLTAWQPSTAYVIGNIVRQGNKRYRCTKAGTSGLTGPNGWTTGEVDGTVEWIYWGANAEIILSGDTPLVSTVKNRIYDNDTILQPFHYASSGQYIETEWAKGEFYGTIYGAGAPEAKVTAGVGTVYIRNDGTAGMYIKSTGNMSTGWTQIT